MSNGAPTVYDVAARAEVSIATVSRVLTNRSTVREATAERVLAAVRELGYVPSGSARGLAAKRTGVVGIVLPDHADTVAPVGGLPPLRVGSAEVPILRDDGTTSQRSPNLYYDEVLRGAEAEAWQQGLGLMIAAGRADVRSGLATSVAGRVDALAIFVGTLPDDAIEHVARRVPVVLLAGLRGHTDLDHVGANNIEGMRTLVRYALESRATASVVYVDGSVDAPDARDRLVGFRAGVADAAADPSVRIEQGDFSRASGRAAAERILQSGVPDLVVCANDQTALGVLDRFAEAGVAVPGRTRVTGFDGIEAGRLATPRLTTVHQPMFELGRLAIATLTERLAEPSLPPRSLLLPVEVLIRDTCP
ncbi:LacI family DNA-binding transcriptional regulator [Microbacteriaceae bacterium VKM Ac-2855]|nr:LacI family DNA-binding transcriptional regulator [Microbacteriaceae bacterium VKM Ac-2855]